MSRYLKVLPLLGFRLLSASTITTADNENVIKKKQKKPSPTERIQANYNNRIKQHSTPEKIFSTFASKTNKKTGKQYMTYHDFREAILPDDFRSKNHKIDTVNPPKFLKSLIPDMNGSNNEQFMMSLAEFMFITILLKINPSEFELAFKIFDTDGNNRMSNTEFAALLNHFKPINTSNYDLSVLEKSPLWMDLFGKDGMKELEFAYFSELLMNLRESILQLEYERFTQSIDNPMSARDFAMSLVSYAHHSHIPWYVARLNRMPDFSEITWHEFMDFNKCLYHIDTIVRSLKFYIGCKEEISRNAFIHAVKCCTDVDLSRNVVDIIFWLFDKDGDNTLDYHEIESLLNDRFSHGQSTERVFLANKWNCFKSCFK